MSRDYCPKTGKEIFTSRHEASTAMRAISARRGRQRARMSSGWSVYECWQCKGWHLTSNR